ncbi:Arabinose 5-phosphate isomerase KdsD [Polystyrenella longa]|uniref:Arabinose 5-phosphate isomerase KdsD n=1 Tax=Polystyrenella longa TaxID=2528007 RepID=A0A518CU39_9PLAN|nr:KpsF/GutQ family sugar-phosphate isomerase [Polystyrenella longa]QDU82750.1 Arabinose 5-phosphate isomerase KdsD [Polystyrenella longa]
MNRAATTKPVSAPLAPAEVESILQEATDVLQTEGTALIKLAGRLNRDFCRAVQLLAECRGTVILTGIGKAGLIAQKISATLSSTGTRAHFLHPVEAVHGDLGFMRQGDTLIAFSNSGETEELLRLIPFVTSLDIPIIAVTAHDQSSLSRSADVVIALGTQTEVGPHGLAPSTSTTSMLGLGDALALVTARRRGFKPEQFAAWHPGGSLGLQFKTVRDLMRVGSRVRVASEEQTVREVLATAHIDGRRTGAIVLVDQQQRLSGIFTDSDLARLLETRHDSLLDAPIKSVMTRNPTTVMPDLLISDAVALLSERKLSELPVIDQQHQPIGMLDITDVISLLPAGSQPIQNSSRARAA